MDELQFTPSTEVWTEVEKRIRKEKKRRRVIFWWLLPLLLAGGGAIYFFSNGKTIDKLAVENKKENPSINSDSNSQPTAPSSTLPADNNKTISERNELTNNNNLLPFNNRQSHNNNNREQANLEISVSPAGVKRKKEVVAPVEVMDTILEAEEKETSVVPPVQMGNENKIAEDKVVEEPKTQSPIKDSVVKANIEEQIVEPKIAEKKATNKKWTFGFSTEAGSSHTKWGSLFEGGLAMYDASPLTSAPGAGSGSYSPVYISAPESGLSMGLSFFAQKDLSKRLNIRASIQYNYLSTEIQTGARIDSTRQVYNAISDGLVINNYYRPSSNGSGGQAQDYTNKYHLAGLSVSIGWKFIHSEKFSLSWENGIGYSRLLSTNALHYDRDLRAYYQDFKPFRKSQIFFTSGLSAPIINKAKFNLAINPFLSYGLTPVLKESDGPNSHFLNYGVGLRFSFPR